MTVTWYENFAEAIAEDEPFYRRCEACGGTGLPPRHTCPRCGEPAMVDASLSTEATIVSHTEIHVTIPKFSGTTPYTVIIAEFDEGVRLTGQLEHESPVSIGDPVELQMGEIEGSPYVAFRPTSE